MNDNILNVGEKLFPQISLNEAQALKRTQKQFMESYLKHKDEMSIDEWLKSEMIASLPEYNIEEVLKMSDEIITTLKLQEEKKFSLEKAINNGRSKESWFASEVEKEISYMNEQDGSKYLQELNEAVNLANESLYRTIHMQTEAVDQTSNIDVVVNQSDNCKYLNLNEYKVKDIAHEIGKQAGQSAIMGAVVEAGFDIAQKVWNGEKIKDDELIKTAIFSGTDFEIKALNAGALKVAVEKDCISILPKGTPASTIANISHVASENVKVIDKIAKGELTIKDGLERMEHTTISSISGIVSNKSCRIGEKIGKTIGNVFGPIGRIVGGVIGGAVGYFAGSKVGECIVSEVRKLRGIVETKISSIGKTISKVVTGGIRNFCNNVRMLFN